MVLAPKLKTFASLDQQYAENHDRLLQLEEQIHYLNRVADALEHDPEFTNELARVDLNLTEKGTERVFVDVSLSMAAPTDTPRRQHSTRTGALSRCLGLLDGVLNDQVWKQKVLLGLAGVVVFAFVFLQDPPKKLAPQRRVLKRKRTAPRTSKTRQRSGHSG